MVSPAYAEFNFDAIDFELNNPISLPLSTSATRKSVVFNGWVSESRNWGTRLHPSATFPTQRYVIEGLGVDGSASVPEFKMNGFMLYCHPDFARALAGTAINGGGTVIDCGGIKLEFDTVAAMATSVRNVVTQYLWRGLHIIGKSWYNWFENIMFRDANSTFSGNADLILENGNHTVDTTNPTPKVNHFKNLKALHTGELDYGILMRSGN